MQRKNVADIFRCVSDDMTVQEAAEALGTSVQTVRAMMRRGELDGRTKPRGSRHTWIPSRTAVQHLLSQHGRLDGRRRNRRTSRVSELERAVEELRHQVAALGAWEASAPAERNLAAERDDLRARIVGLEEAFVHVRHAADLQRRADEERAALVEHLLAAAAAGERTDVLRREALEVSEAAIAALSRPGHLGS